MGLLRDFFVDLAAFGRAPALVSAERVTTYAELDALARGFLAELGERRRLVFLEIGNRVESIAAYLACLLGRHPVYLFAPQDRARTEALASLYEPNIVAFAEPDGYAIQRRRDRDHALNDRLSVLLSTSGSTGTPKFVKLSRENISSNARSIAGYLGLDATDRAATTLKMNYSYGLSVVNSHLAAGASLLLTDDSVVAPRFQEEFAALAATNFAGVPYTFELLERDAAWLTASPTLRHVTQAGGRLPPETVRRYAKLSQAGGWRFFVMYGQTEASPRMAYLPPELAEQNPHCIGVPIPGGAISLLDENARPIEAPDTPGELVYSGPNVMMGYAQSPVDLAADEAPPRLFTGDLACRNAAGLYYIVGRTSRFVKPFGARIDLDQVEAKAQAHFPGAVATGTDSLIVVAVDSRLGPETEALAAELAAAYALPRHAFRIVGLESIPRLASQKPDYQAVLAAAGVDADAPPATAAGGGLRALASIVLSPRYARQVGVEVLKILGFTAQNLRSVTDVYRSILGAEAVGPEDSFTGLAGDSLSYVQVELALEELFDRLPPEWPRMTVRDLETRRTQDRA